MAQEHRLLCYEHSDEHFTTTMSYLSSIHLVSNRDRSQMILVDFWLNQNATQPFLRTVWHADESQGLNLRDASQGWDCGGSQHGAQHCLYPAWAQTQAPCGSACQSSERRSRHQDPEVQGWCQLWVQRQIWLAGHSNRLPGKRLNCICTFKSKSNWSSCFVWPLCDVCHIWLSKWKIVHDRWQCARSREAWSCNRNMYKQIKVMAISEYCFAISSSTPKARSWARGGSMRAIINLTVGQHIWNTWCGRKCFLLEGCFPGHSNQEGHNQDILTSIQPR